MPNKINARTLIIDLLFAEPTAIMSTRHFLLAAKLFGISDNSTRVALTRLCSENCIESAGRGLYKLTRQVRISEPVANRAKDLTLTREWTGQYLAVHTGALGRVDRSALKRRERTLRLNGFRELQSDLFIRPDNLAESFEVTQARLFNTGLDSGIPVFIISKFNTEVSPSIAKLWDSKSLIARYKKTSQHIQQWLKDYQHMELEVATRESLVIGRLAIPLLMSDPLLPAPLIDIAIRQQFVEDVQLLDKVGHQLWQQFFQQSLNTADNSTD